MYLVLYFNRTKCYFIYSSPSSPLSLLPLDLKIMIPTIIMIKQLQQNNKNDPPPARGSLYFWSVDSSCGDGELFVAVVLIDGGGVDICGGVADG